MSGILNGCMSEQAEEVELLNLHLEYLDFRTDGRGRAHDLHLEYVDVRADRRRRAREPHSGNHMSEQTNEGERMHCILNIWMSEHAEEGGGMTCI